MLKGCEGSPKPVAPVLVARRGGAQAPALPKNHSLEVFLFPQERARRGQTRGASLSLLLSLSDVKHGLAPDPSPPLILSLSKDEPLGAEFRSGPCLQVRDYGGVPVLPAPARLTERVGHLSHL